MGHNYAFDIIDVACLENFPWRWSLKFVIKICKKSHYALQKNLFFHFAVIFCSKLSCKKCPLRSRMSTASILHCRGSAALRGSSLDRTFRQEQWACIISTSVVHSKEISINLNDVCCVLFCGSNCSTFSFLNYLHERGNYFFISSRGALVGGIREDTHSTTPEGDLMTYFSRSMLYSQKLPLYWQTLVFQYTHMYVFLNPESIMLRRKKVISNLKIKQKEAIQNVKPRRKPQNYWGPFSHFSVYNTK